MKYRDFVLKLLGFKKPSILQMLIRRVEIFYEKSPGLDFLSVRPEKQSGLDKRIVSNASPLENKYRYNLINDININENDCILDIGCAKGSALKYR